MALKTLAERQAAVTRSRHGDFAVVCDEVAEYARSFLYGELHAEATTLLRAIVAARGGRATVEQCGMIARAYSALRELRDRK